MEVFEQIYKHPLLQKTDFERIISAHKKVHFQKGDLLLQEGQTANEYFILKKGIMRSYIYDYKKDNITTSFFSEGELVIEVSSLFQRIPTKENIEALTDCVCWKIEFDKFQNLFHSLNGFREWGRSWLSTSLFYFKQRSISIIAESASERYLSLIKEKPQVVQFAPLKYIASYLGVTDTSLSRIRKEITQNGM